MLRRKELGALLASLSGQTHSELPTAPATVQGGWPMPYESEWEEPPAPDAMLAFVLSFFPTALARDWEHFGAKIEALSDIGFLAMLYRFERHEGLGWSKKAIHTTNGLFDPFSPAIYVREGTFPFRSRLGFWAWQNVEDVCGHEMGHFVDWLAEDISLAPEFERVWKSERFLLDNHEAADPREFFATACWICRRYPKASRLYLPEAHRWFREFFSQADKYDRLHPAEQIHFSEERREGAGGNVTTINANKRASGKYR